MKKPTHPRAADSAQSAEKSELIRAHLDACVDVDETRLRETERARSPVTTQHTPGPWRIKDTVDGPSIRANGERVAEVYFESDARLIAAAPQLLKALRDLLGEIDENECGQSMSVRIGRAHAAIAAATGDAR